MAPWKLAGRDAERSLGRWKIAGQRRVEGKKQGGMQDEEQGKVGNDWEGAKREGVKRVRIEHMTDQNK